MDSASFQERLQTFYQQPSQSLAEELIHWWVTTPHSMQGDLHENPRNIALYAFIRLAGLYPELLREYEKLFDLATPWGKEFLARVLSHCADEQTIAWAKTRETVDRASELKRLAAGKRRDLPRMFPIHTSFQLDLWWMEFFLTGDAWVLREISKRLEYPSEVRRRLNKWLSRRGPIAWLNSRRRRLAIETLEDRFGIVCDQSEVKNREDLDCLCLEEDSIGDIRHIPFSEVAKYLPFHVWLVDRLSIGVKMMAKWSLLSNALQHPIVRNACVDAADHVEDWSEAKMNRSLALLDIAANIQPNQDLKPTFFAEGNGSESLKLARRYVEMDPHSRRLQRTVGKLETAKELKELLDADCPDCQDQSNNQPNMKDLLEDCIEQTGKATSYTTVRRVKSEIQGKQQLAEWRLAFEHPDRFEVYQRIGDKEDAWFTIEGATFHRLHLLAQAAQPDPGDEPAVNRKLLVGTILDHLLIPAQPTSLGKQGVAENTRPPCGAPGSFAEPNSIVSMRVDRFGLSEVGCGYMVLVGTLPAVPPFAIELGASKGDECQVDVWIDKAFNKMLRLCKFSLRAGPLEFEQAFAGYNDTRVSLEEFS